MVKTFFKISICLLSVFALASLTPLQAQQKTPVKNVANKATPSTTDNTKQPASKASPAKKGLQQETNYLSFPMSLRSKEKC